MAEQTVTGGEIVDIDHQQIEIAAHVVYGVKTKKASISNGGLRMLERAARGR